MYVLPIVVKIGKNKEELIGTIKCEGIVTKDNIGGLIIRKIKINRKKGEILAVLK